MINCVRDDKKTVVSASGNASQVAADCCEVIRAIYFEIPVEIRPLFKECVLLAVNHKDSPMCSLRLPARSAWWSAPKAKSF